MSADDQENEKSPARFDGSRENPALAKDEAQSWVPHRPGIDHNVLIVGGGQNGSAFAFALSRAGIGGVSVIDAADDEDRIGVWLTRARMNRLRTPKGLVGPELGFASLSFQAWYERRHGVEAYAVFDRIARTDWAQYLQWFRDTLGIEVRLRTRLKSLEPVAGHFRVHLEVDGKPVVEHARKLILANGVGGSGGPAVPAVLAGLPASHRAHTADAIAFDALAGKDVAVVGSAASAFDAAAAALEAGARQVHLFVRRNQIAAATAFRSIQYPGAFENYAYLPDRIRWRMALRSHAYGTTPPVESIDRVVRFPNFHLHLAAPWDEARLHDGRVVASVRGERFEFDFVIAGTGYAVDLERRPELAAIVEHVALWKDRYQPPAGEENAELGRYPYLGRSHELQEKKPGSAPWLRHLHLYNPGAHLSFGLPTGDVLTMRRSIPQIVTQIGRDLFLADLDHHEQRLFAPVAPDFGIDRYAAALWHGPAADQAQESPAGVAPPMPRPGVRAPAVAAAGVVRNGVVTALKPAPQVIKEPAAKERHGPG